MSAAYIERSNVLTHLVAPYRGQATRDVGVLNMYSECKSSAEARAPRGCLRPPHSIPRPHISKPAGRFPNLPPPPSSPTHTPSGPLRTPGATRMLIGLLIYCFNCHYL